MTEKEFNNLNIGDVVWDYFNLTREITVRRIEDNQILVSKTNLHGEYFVNYRFCSITKPMTPVTSILFDNIITSSINTIAIKTLDINYFSVDLVEERITFIRKNKFEKMENDFFNPILRAKYEEDMSVGSFLNKYCDFREEYLLSIEHQKFNKTLRIEKAVNEIKTKWYTVKQENIIEIVSGEKIRYYYHEENYDGVFEKESKVLFNSCMRYNTCQEYLDVYVENCEMIILRKKDSNKIFGRCLLWEDIDGVKGIDRIYSSDAGKIVLQNFAKENGYKDFYEKRNDETIFIQLKKEYYYIPYMDTFFYEFSVDESVYLCSTDYYKDIEITFPQYCEMRQDLKRTKGNSTFYCDMCGGEIELDEEVFVEDRENPVCERCLGNNYVYSENSGTYRHIDDYEEEEECEEINNDDIQEEYR